MKNKQREITQISKQMNYSINSWNMDTKKKTEEIKNCEKHID